MNKKNIFIILLFIFLIGCAPQQVTIDDRAETVEPMVNRPPSTVTNTPLSTPTIVPPSGTLSVTETLFSSQSIVTITAINGNLYIRRGPGTKYSRIGILMKGERAEIIGRDVLSKWVQVKIPNSDLTGWISILTEYSQIDGDLSQIPDFTFTDFPLPAYIKNCTEHELFIEPGEYYLYDVSTSAEYLNEVRVDSGVYYIYDASLPDLPLIETVDLQEDETAYIMVNGLEESHKCP